MSQNRDHLRARVALASALAVSIGCSSADAGPTESRASTAAAPRAATQAAAGSGAAPASGNPAPSQTLLPQPGGNTTTVLPTSAGKPVANGCEVLQLVTDPVIPEMMIVLDRSGSMTEGGRWQPSVAAVRRVTQELQSKIHFGLTLFPNPDAAGGGTAVNNIADCFGMRDPQRCIEQFNTQNDDKVACAAGKIVVPVAQNTAGMIASTLDKTTPFGGTPTSGTLEQIITSFGQMDASPDAKPHPKFVLLVTDGMPTCPAGHGSETTQPDIDASNAAIEALAAVDVRTYVIGYDTSGPSNTMLASVLDGFAQRGGTGDMKHRTVEDESSLLTELTRITFAIASCSFQLNAPPDQADHVLVRLDGKQVNLGSPDGFALVGDRTIELRGDSCARYREGNHLIDAQVLCEVVQPQ